MFLKQMGHLMSITYLFPTSHLQSYNLPTNLPIDILRCNTYLTTHIIHTYLPKCFAYLYLLTSLSTHLYPTYTLITYLSTHLPICTTYLFIHPPTHMYYLTTYPPTYNLPTYQLPTYLPTHLPKCTT